MNKKTKEKKVETYEVVRKKTFWEWLDEGPIILIFLSIITFLVGFSSNIPLNIETNSFLYYMVFTGVFFSSIICGTISALIILYIIYLITAKRIVKVKK